LSARQFEWIAERGQRALDGISLGRLQAILPRVMAAHCGQQLS
jgi:hypothetical protein